VQVLVSFERADCVARWQQVGSHRISEKLIQAGQVWILPPGVRHEVEWRREADLIKLHLEPAWAEESAGQKIKDISLEALARYIQSAPIIGELCGLLRHQGRAHGPLNEPLASGLGAALATQLMASHFQNDASGHPQHWLLPRPILVDVCTYIDAHQESPFSLLL
jgi:hypothetical protein